MKKQSSVLLPAHIKPIHYNIFLAPDLDNFIFEGEETITVSILKPTKEITLHSAEIEVLTVSVGKETTNKITYNKKAETVTFTFSNPIPKGKAKISIKFTGILNDKMRGFYRSRYEHDGKTYHMGVTQFESTDARRAFPNFDEPAHKATFEVSLKVPSDRTVISNTIETEILEHSGGFKTVKFAPTPKMSSYLLAFIIGHFEYIEKKTKEGVSVRVFVTPGKKEQAKFALDVAARLMTFYHNYFGVPYPISTMDLIAIPDFANGAMENWGAVTYRETALLVDPENSSLITKQWVALIIAHELAHQWFGNLVTMEWWTHLWLNEGFASFMEYLAIDKLFPKWNIWTQFVYTEQAKALSLDGLENTHPIEVPVRHPGEISEIFDAVSYSKGASVIRMIESYVGEKNFQKGLNRYLKTHKYSNASTSDLWNALQKASGKPVGKIMKNWTSRSGYPVVTVEKANGKLTLSQERFYSSPLIKNKEKTSWLIPLSIISDDNKKPTVVLVDKKTKSLSGFTKTRWLKANADDTSFVRVRYSDELLNEIEKPIKKGDKRLNEETRFALVRDAFALSEAGYIPTSEALDLLTGYADEKGYTVWTEIVTHLFELKFLLFGTQCYEPFKKYSRKLLAVSASQVGWSKKKGESHQETLLRSTILFAYGSFGDSKTISKAKEMFERMNKGVKIDSDIKSLIFSLVAENGGKNEFDVLVKIYKTASSEEEKDRALRALCSFKQKEFLQKTLTLAFSKDVRAQDAFKAVTLMSLNPLAIDLAWEFVTINWKELEERFAGGHLFSRFILPFSKFSSTKKAEVIEKFFAKNKSEGIERTVAQTVEKIRTNAGLIKRDKISIENFLKERN
jgi:puromycin-sensitive aminopeptidase